MLAINIELGHNSIISDIVVQVDAGENLYQYNNCDRVFSHKDNLEMHMRIHSGEKPYQCTNRDKVFSQNGNLEIHMSTHSG